MTLVAHPADMATDLSTLDLGVVFLDDTDAPTALYRVVADHLAAADGTGYWLDARNAANPDAIRRHGSRTVDRSLRVARAFTAYQHYELARSLPGRLSKRASLVVAPNVAALYAEDDAPGFEADAMFDATLELLDAVAAAIEVPVLVTASERRDRVRAAADRTIDAEQTRVGLRVAGGSLTTDAYRQGGALQTTIPYWVRLLGAATERAEELPADAATAGV
jgi:hypothetical protein